MRDSVRLQDPRIRTWAGAALLVLAALLVYLPAIPGEFLWDDLIMVANNPLLKAPDGLQRIWFSLEGVNTIQICAPLTLTSFWLEWRLWGANPVGYHLVNVLLHAAGAILLWRVLARLRLPGGWIAGLLFAVHPLCVGSAAWISERKNTLSGVFYLLSLYWYLRSQPAGGGARGQRAGTERRRPRAEPPLKHSPTGFYLLSLLAFVAALLSKPSVVVLPLILVLLAWWRNTASTRPAVDRSGRTRHPFPPRALLATLPFFLLAFGFGLMAIWIQHSTLSSGPAPNESLGTRLLAGTWVLWFYLSKILFPVGLCPIYPRWPINPLAFSSYLPGLAWAGLLTVAWVWRRAWGGGVFCALMAFTLTLLPVLGVFVIYYPTFSRAADHWAYLAVLPVLALAGASFATAWRRRQSSRLSAGLLLLAGGATVVALGVLAHGHARVYASGETLWRYTLSQNPQCWAAHNNLGWLLAERGQDAEATNHFAAALRLNPLCADAHNNWGRVLLRQRRYDEANAHFSQALAAEPNNPEGHGNLGALLLERGDLAAAADYFTVATRRQPPSAEAHHSLGLVRARQGRLEEAARLYNTALRIDPSLPEAHNDLADLLAKQNQFDAAERHLREAIRARPGFAQAYFNLGAVLVRQGRLADALVCYQAAVRFQPDYVDAHLGLGAMLASQNQLQPALAEFDLVLRLRPDDSEALANSALVLSALGRNDDAMRRYDRAAAALADAGQFAEAAQACSNALVLATAAKDPALVSRLQAHLRACLESRRFRD